VVTAVYRDQSGGRTQVAVHVDLVGQVEGGVYGCQRLVPATL
jgi:hypothetical protein